MKTRDIILTILLAMACTAAFSQSTFRKTINIGDRDKGKYIGQTSDGGYIITGDTYNYGSLENVFLAKTDMYGDTLWAKTYDGGHQEYSYCVKETLDEGFIIAAHTNLGSRAWIIKTNATGDTLWTRMLDGRIYNILPTADSAYLLAGYENYNSEAVLRKMDQAGELIWTKSYGFSKIFYELVELSGDRIMVGGLSEMNELPFSTTIELFMTNHSGDSLWVKQYGDAYIYSNLSLQNTYDGGYIISATKTLAFGDGNIYLHKVDSVGNTQWTKVFGTFGKNYFQDISHGVVQTPDSGYMLTGEKYMLKGEFRQAHLPGKGNSGMFLLKTDQHGDSLWEKNFDTDTTRTSGYGLIKTADDHIVVCGEELSPSAATSNVLLLKVDQEGLITNLAEVKNQEKIAISPNPNQGNFRVNILDGDRELMIYDLTGRLILKQKINPHESESFQVTDLNKGSYLIQIKSAKAYRTAKVLVL
jgi:hypothetical protein